MRLGHVIDWPSVRPISAAPIGVMMEMRFSAMSASSGNTSVTRSIAVPQLVTECQRRPHGDELFRQRTATHDLCAFKLGMEIFGHLRHLTRGSVSQTGQPGVIGLRHDDLGAAFGADSVGKGHETFRHKTRAMFRSLAKIGDG